MKIRTLVAAASVASLVLPASATWTYVASAGKYNGNADKEYSGAITDGATWTIYVLQLSDGTWQLGAGTWGINVNGGACIAGDSSSKNPIPYDGANYTGVGSGVLDLSTLPTDLPDMSFTAVGPRAFGGHTAMTKVILPTGITTIGIAAFQGCTALLEADISQTQIASLPDATNTSSAWYRGVFQNCTAMTNAYLPTTITYVGNAAFGWLKNSNNVQLHFPGDVPTFHASGAFCGDKNKQWALYVNALQYPSWKTSFATGTYTTDAPFPQYDGEKVNWLPSFLQDSTIYGDPAVLFGYTKAVPPMISSSERVYLVQEGEAGETTPASMGVSQEACSRDSVTLKLNIDLGTSTSAEVSVTLNGETQSFTYTETSVTNIVFSGLSLDTAYTWTASIQGSGDSSASTSSGSVATQAIDLTLGATDYTLARNGLSATLTVELATLIATNGASVALSLDGAAVGTAQTVTETGTVTFEVSDLTLQQEYTYTFTATSLDHAEDVATNTVTFTALPYHWIYKAGSGYKNGQPYTGTLTDQKWVLYVYQPDASSDAFWLGEGNSGSTGYETAGEPDLDLSTVYHDTKTWGDSDAVVKIVRVSGYCFSQKGSVLTSIVLPNTVTNIGKQAFFQCTGLTDLDLSNTKLVSVDSMGFQNCTSLTNIVLPETFAVAGSTAFAWGPSKRVIHFHGDVPAVTASTDSGTEGADQSFYAGNKGRQYAYCVDAKTYPRWTTDASTTLYTTENPFPEGEKSWIPEWVRYGSETGFTAPFGNSTLGRSFDDNADGRAYLIQESLGGGTMVVIY